jgi:hypothetical protein
LDDGASLVFIPGRSSGLTDRMLSANRQYICIHLIDLDCGKFDGNINVAFHRMHGANGSKTSNKSKVAWLLRFTYNFQGQDEDEDEDEDDSGGDDSE